MIIEVRLQLTDPGAIEGEDARDEESDTCHYDSAMPVRHWPLANGCDAGYYGDVGRDEGPDGLLCYLWIPKINADVQRW